MIPFSTISWRKYYRENIPRTWSCDAILLEFDGAVWLQQSAAIYHVKVWKYVWVQLQLIISRGSFYTPLIILCIMVQQAFLWAVRTTCKGHDTIICIKVWTMIHYSSEEKLVLIIPPQNRYLRRLYFVRGNDISRVSIRLATTGGAW